MKKTISVNIKGTNFLIEEDAYELLQDYLDRLEQTLKSQDGSKEIIEDVELRIAEICSSKISDSKTVIELKDIEEILNRLGDPSAYVDEDDDTEQERSYQQEKQGSYTKSEEKRLFRDTDDAVIAGVCQGIANFFGIDVVIIRILFVVFFFTGFGFFLYIILWAVVPKTKSSIDRLRMKGVPITVETVREEVESAAERLKDKSQSFSQRLRKDDSIRTGINRGARIVTSVIGTGMIAFGLVLLILFMIFIVGGFRFIPFISQNGPISVSELGELVLNDSHGYSLAWIASLLIGFGIILFTILLGSTILMRIKNSWTKLSFFGLFFAALFGGFMALYLGLKTARDFTIDGEIELEVGASNSQILVIDPLNTHLGSINGYEIKSNGHLGLMSMDDKNIYHHEVDFEYKLSPDSSFHVFQRLSAHGASAKLANRRAGNIKHTVMLENDTLKVAPDYHYSKEDKIRDQEVTIVVLIPKDGIVRIKGKNIRLGDDDVVESLVNPNYTEYGTLESEGDYHHHD